MTAGNPVPPDEVRAMFDRISPVYDLMNTVMTAGIDARWRRAAIAAAGLEPGMRFLDVACGTGTLTREAARRVAPGGEAIGVDFAPRMIGRATAVSRRHGTNAAPRYEVADALALPFDDARFDAVTIGFGLRNVRDYATAIGEMARVARPGGRIVVLELATPPAGPARVLYRTWFHRVVPVFGRVVGSRAAYRYLPESVDRYPAPEAIAALLERAGLMDVRWSRLTGGFVTLHRGVRAA